MADQDWFAQNAPGQPQQSAQAPATQVTETPTSQPAAPAPVAQATAQDQNWFEANAPAPAPKQAPVTPPVEQKKQGWWDSTKDRLKHAIVDNEAPGFLPYDIYMHFHPEEDPLRTSNIPTPSDEEVKKSLESHNGATDSTTFESERNLIKRQRQEGAISSKQPEGEERLLSPEKFLTADEKKSNPFLYGLLHAAGGLTTQENMEIMAGSGGLGFFGEAAAVTPKLGVIASAVSKLPRIVSAYFAGQMAVGTAQQIPGLVQAKKEYDQALANGDQKKADDILWNMKESAAEMGVNAYMTYAAAHHASTGHPEPVVKSAADLTSGLARVTKNKGVDIAKTVADNAADYTKAKLTNAVDVMGRAVGRTDDFNKAITSVANKLDKKTGPEFRDKVTRVSSDLKDIINSDVDNKIVDPKTAADAIDRHLNSLEAPLQAEAGAAKDSTEPVVPNFAQRLQERLDKFFDDNRQKYGSANEVSAIKDRIIDRLTGEHDVGDSTKVPRDINLYEAENARQGLNKSSGDVFENGTSSGYRAASADAANFLREVIDESYNSKGVSNVKESRAKEADLIDVRDALRDAQATFEKQNNMPTLLKLFSLGKAAGLVGGIAAHFLGGNIIGGGLAAGTLWKSAHEHFTKNIESNLGRAQDLAAREPSAEATTPGSTPPMQGPQVGPPTAPLPPGVPPPPTPPTPATPPAVNHALNGTLSTYFGNFVNEQPYESMMQNFVNQVANMKQDIAAAKADPNYKPKYTQDQIDKASKVQAQINVEHAKEHAQVEKQNTAAQAKYQKDFAKYNQDVRVKAEQAKIEEEQRAAQDKSVVEAAEQARVDKIKNDPRIAHSPLMFSTDPALEINGVEGRASREAHRHEHGHIMANVAEGLNPFAYVTEAHPDAAEIGAAAQVHTDVSGAEEGNKGIAQRVIGILGGPAFDEVHQGVSLGRNTGARADIARAREILREEGGLRGNQLEKVFDALYDRAKEHISNPEAIALAEANADLRESGLHKNFHMSPGRMEAYVKLLKGAYRNGETPSTEGVREGDSNGAVSEGESVGTGSSGSKQDGAAAGARTEAAPENREEPAGKPAAKEDADRRISDDDPDYKAGIKAAAEHGGYLTTSGLQRELGNGIGYGKAARVIDRLREEGHVNSERGNLKNSLPPERSTGDEGIDAAIKEGGGIPGGLQKGDPEIDLKDLALFHDPKSGSTLAYYADSITPEKVKEQLEKSRAQYAEANRRAANKKLEKESFQGVHFSGVPAEEGVVRGASRGAAKAGSEQARVALGAEPGVYAYREGAHFEPQIASRANKYSISGDKAIADISGPQGAIFNKAAEAARGESLTAGDSDTVAAHKAINAGETAIKNAGYDGYENKDYPGSTFLFGDQKVQPYLEKSNLTKAVADAADDYNKEEGRGPVLAERIPHSSEVAKQIADAYEVMTHNPKDPKVKTSYDAFKNDIDKQYDYATKKMGMKFEPWTKEGQPYANSKEMVSDVRDNKHLYFFQGGDFPEGHPTQEIDPKTGLSYNDKFRAVHDLFGHAANENQFGPKGEENAWNDHRQMFSPEAIPAMTAETRGQNSWVNFGKHLRNTEGNVPTKGEEGYLSPTERPFAEQKAGLLPEQFNSLNVEKSALTKGSSVPLMEKPLKVKGTGENEKISTLDVAQALNKFSTKQHPALELDEAEPEKMVARAKKIAEDEAKYQLAQGKTGTEWYTTEMKDHDDALKSVRPEFEDGEPINAPTAWPHNPKLSLFKAAEAILSSGQKPYGNFKSAIKAWDIYNETGEFPRTQPDGKSWGPRGAAAYGNAMNMLNTLVGQKGEKGAAEWLLSEHPVSELKEYNKDVKGKKDDTVPGAMILGAKRGPFMQNLHGIESAFTADMWVTRTWNRWMGTMEAGKNSFTGEPEIQPSAPRNKTERDLMHKSFSETADKLGLSTSSLQAVLWYYEQALYSKQGIPKESWSFRDAAKRAVSEMPKNEEAVSFNFGNSANKNDQKMNGFANMVRPNTFVNLTGKNK